VSLPLWSSQVVTEQALVQHSEAFECAVAGGDVAALKDLCSHKAAAAAAAEDAETWTFLGVMFEDDARRQLLAKLGFSEVLAAGVGPGRSTSVGMAAAGEHLAAAAEHLRLSADGECAIPVASQQLPQLQKPCQKPRGLLGSWGTQRDVGLAQGTWMHGGDGRRMWGKMGWRPPLSCMGCQ
jgi:hypothetical protein